MRRAIHALTLAVFALAFMTVTGHTDPQVVERINGIGILDYAHKPTFKVGDWVRYRMSGESALGMTDDYELTILIAGEEDWWGEECFWVETWTDARGRAPQTSATLMSYAIFADTAAIQRMQIYQRKTFSGISATGDLVEEVTRPAASALKSRTAYERPTQWDVDTLEADTVQTPAGLFHARKVSIRQGTAVTSNMPDSTLYTEVRENRMMWFTLDVPITHLAREDVENTIARRSWLVGRSAEGSPLRLKERGTGSARLVGYGNGLKSRVLPVERQKSLAQWRAEVAKKKAAPPTRAAGTKRR